MYKVSFFCLLILSIPLLEARKSGGSSGGFRGSSGARTSSNAGAGFNPNRGSQSGGQNFGGRPGNTGFQQPNYGGNPGGGFRGPVGGNNYHYPSGFNSQGWNKSPGFSNGGGLGSVSRASTFKHALAGAALGTIGGLLVFEAGKAIINSATSPFHHSGRDYYFDQQNYRGPTNVPRCSVPLQQIVNTNAPSSDGNTTTTEQLANIQFRDGSKPREVVWSCNVGEVCCGTDCCPAPVSQNAYSPNGGSGNNVGWILLIIILVLLMGCCIACFCAYKFCRSTIEGFLPSSRNQNQDYYDDGGNKYDYQGQPSQSYPMNPYPQQNQYPNYPPQNYPNYPPGPRY